MYQPKHFSHSDTALAHELMRAHPFATLLTAHNNAPEVTHCPLVLSEDGSGIYGHVARANPHHSMWQIDQTALAIFHGPQGYVSPNWYAPENAVLAVPTWNYVVVHAHGTLKLIDEPAAKDALLKRLIAHTEPAYAEQWHALPEDHKQRMLQAIVGFRIDITQLDAKYKLSQNRPAADKPRVIEQVREQQQLADRTRLSLADWMQRLVV
jgi:transcriptional regulator